jgi:hypothetical protein
MKSGLSPMFGEESAMVAEMLKEPPAMPGGGMGF